MLHLDEIAHLIATLAYIGGDDGIVCAFFFPFFNSRSADTPRAQLPLLIRRGTVLRIVCCAFVDVEAIAAATDTFSLSISGN